MSSVAIIPYGGADVDRAAAWADLPEGERKRQATAAAADHDAAALWRTTESWLRLYSRKGATISPRTLQAYRGAIVPPREQEGGTIGKERLCDPLLVAWRQENLLHPSRMAGTSWIRRMERKGAKRATIVTYLAAGRALYAALRAAGATAADPFKDVFPAPDPVPRWEKRQPYTAEHLERLLEQANQDERLLVLLGWHAGLRATEMVMLRWEDIDLARRQLVVEHAKGGRRRTVPLSQTLAGALAAAAGMSGPVLELQGEWTWDKGRGYAGPQARRLRAWYLLDRLAERAGVPSLGLHALRHSAGTRMYAQSEDIEATKRFLGHQRLDTTAIYVAFSDTKVKKTVERW